MLLIATVVFLHWLFTVYRAVGTKTKPAGLCSSLYIIYILFINNKITSCAMTKRTNEICYFLSLTLLFLSCFTWSPVFLVVLFPSSPVRVPYWYCIILVQGANRQRASQVPHLIVWLACIQWRAAQQVEWIHAAPSRKGSGFFPLGFCSPAGEVTESVAVQRILC